MESGKYSGGSPAKIDWRVTEVSVGTQANAVDSWKRHAGSLASRFFRSKKPLIEGKAIQHDQSNLGEFFPCPLDGQEAGNLMHHHGLLVVRQIVQRAVALHHPLAENILHLRLQITSRPFGRRCPEPRPTPSAAQPVPPSVGPLAAIPGVTRRRWEVRPRILPQATKSANGIGLGIMNHACSHPCWQVGNVLLFDRRQRSF